MHPLAIQLPAYENQTEFNLRRWEEVLADPLLARLEQRIETDRHGRILMSPPPFSFHSNNQTAVLLLLHDLLPDGQARVEVPVSTPDGVRAADVAWTSDARYAAIYDRRLYLEAPDICVEVLSPSNTPQELAEKRALYFASGAVEVWFCEEDGTLRFFGKDAPSEALERSGLCPAFPGQLG